MNESENFKIDLSHPKEDNPGNSLLKTCADLYAKTELVDCTISCSDGHLQAHRIVLASASTYLSNLLTSTPLPNPCSHPILFLRNSSLADARCAMEYIYTGKTQTSKNRLSALLAVSQELGCVSLLKAIENAIQTCGIETFRRLAKTASNNTNTKNGHSSPHNNSIIETEEQAVSPPASSQPAITVNQDIFDEQDDYYDDDEPVAEDMSFLNSSNNNNNNNNNYVSDTTKIKRPAASSVKSNGKTNGGPPPHTWKVPRLMNLSTNKNGIKLEDQNGSNNSRNSATMELNLQHDKGESFVYTNKDFVMKDHEEDDQDESGDEEEVDTDVPQSVVNINQLLKTEIKEESTTLPASCPWCMQVFTNLTLLQKHIRSHVSNYRPFTCEYCHNTFARSAHLKRHLRTHTGEKPYKCSVCQRPFARQDKLKTHLERHLQNAAKPSNNPMMITSYPPVSLSQNSGGQVPIKVLLPLGKQMNGTSTTTTNNKSINSSSTNNRFGIPTSNNNGLSISIANLKTENTRSNSSAGGLIVTPGHMPSSTTITPILNGGGVIPNDCNNRTKMNKPMTLNFLVK